MRRCHEAKKLAGVLRASLEEVVAAEDICYEGQSIKVLPRTCEQVQSVVRVCSFHRVSWSLEIGPKPLEDSEMCRVDVVLSLAMLLGSNNSMR